MILGLIIGFLLGGISGIIVARMLFIIALNDFLNKKRNENNIKNEGFKSYNEYYK